MNAPKPCDLDAIRQHFDHFRPHQTDSFERSRSCCSAHGPANDVPALLDEVERLRARVAELTTDRDAWRADRNKLARAIQGVRAVADRCASGEWPESTGPVTGAMLAELLAALEKIAGGAS